LAGRKLIMVLLDSAGKYSRIGDAERLRKWVADTSLVPALAPAAARVGPMSAGLPSGASTVQPR
jgi:D-alanyl-D-alanine endopeptidase (penicillin-binding protein 7)